MIALKRKVLKALSVFIICFGIFSLCENIVAYAATTGETVDRFGYEIYDNGEVCVTEYNGNLKNVVVPEKINGKLVTSMEMTFYYNDTVTSVTLPESIESIAWGTFYGCDELRSVNIPKTVTEIGSYVFDGCFDLVISCEKDSYAEEYAIEEGIQYKLIGEKRPLTECEAHLDGDSFIYSGEYIKPGLEVGASIGRLNVLLIQGRDYEIEYKNNKNAGTATVIVTGIGNYTGEVQLKFKIKPYNISNMEASIKQTSFEYTGDYIKPKVTVSGYIQEYLEEDYYCGNKIKLVKGKDYKVKYENYKKPGTAKITVTGIGNYTGGHTLDFEIRKYDIKKLTASIKKTSYNYTGKYIKPVVTVKGKVGSKAVTLTNGKDYKVTYKKNKNVGTATIEIKGIGVYKGTKKLTFKIKPISISGFAASINQDTFTYTGKYIKPVVKVKGKVAGKSVTLKKTKDYKVSLSNYKNPGKATIVVTGIGNYKGIKTLSFTIKPSWVKEAKLNNISTTSVKLEWKKCAGVTGYEIYRATSKNGKYSKVATLSTNTNTYTNSGLGTWTKYYYKIRAYKNAGKTKIYGSYSSVVTASKVCASGHVCSKATCTSSAKCKNCGWIKQEPLGHSVDYYGICVRCKKNFNFEVIGIYISYFGELKSNGEYEISREETNVDEKLVYKISYNTNTNKITFCFEKSLYDGYYEYLETLTFKMDKGNSNISVKQTLKNSAVQGSANVSYSLPVSKYCNDYDYTMNVTGIKGDWTSNEVKVFAKLNNQLAFKCFDSLLETYTGYGLDYLGFKKY